MGSTIEGSVTISQPVVRILESWGEGWKASRSPQTSEGNLYVTGLDQSCLRFAALSIKLGNNSVKAQWLALSWNFYGRETGKGICHQIEIHLIEFRIKECDWATNYFNTKWSKMNVNSQCHHTDSAIWSLMQPLIYQWLKNGEVLSTIRTLWTLNKNWFIQNWFKHFKEHCK